MRNISWSISTLKLCRFCFPLPALEYPDSDQAQADLQIIDISSSSTTSNTVIAGSVSVEEVLSPRAATKKDGEGGSDGKVEKKEENNNTSAQVKEVAKLPEEAVALAAQAIPEVEAGTPKPEERKDEPVVVEVSSSAKKVKEVASSTQMAPQEVSAGLHEIDPLPATQIVSPAEFSISLVAEVNFS